MAMTIMTAPPTIDVAGGVDTHADVHVAAVIDTVGRELGQQSFATTPAGYDHLLAWMSTFGTVTVIGVEGTGAYGAGLTRSLNASGADVVEVDRPDRKSRRFHGKSDPLDAYAAARAALSGRAAGIPKSQTGPVEMIRVLRVARSSAVKAKAMAWNQLRAVIKSAPAPLREELRHLSKAALLDRCAGLRPARAAHSETASPLLIDPTAATKRTLAVLARRIRHLQAEILDVENDLNPLIARTAPTLSKLFGVGPDVAGQLLTTAGDNPDRLASEAAFAHLCGVAPVPASSGKTTRYRLNRGGDRQANAALWRIAITRLNYHDDTKAYRDRRAAEQKSNKDIIRCLKRYLAREVYRALINDLSSPQQTP